MLLLFRLLGTPPVALPFSCVPAREGGKARKRETWARNSPAPWYPRYPRHPVSWDVPLTHISARPCPCSPASCFCFPEFTRYKKLTSPSHGYLQPNLYRQQSDIHIINTSHHRLISNKHPLGQSTTTTFSENNNSNNVLFIRFLQLFGFFQPIFFLRQLLLQHLEADGYLSDQHLFFRTRCLLRFPLVAPPHLALRIRV